MASRLHADLDSCFEVKKILRWDNVERYLNNYNLWHNPDILAMFERNNIEFRNDSHCKFLRCWIEEENVEDFQLFDLICETFGIEHEFATYGEKEDNTELIFWISW